MDALCGTLVSLLLLAQPPPKPGFEAALKRVLEAAPKRFAAIKGAKFEFNPGPRVWYEARVSLPGATECRVEHRLDEYRCRWDSSPARAVRRYSELLAAVETALGPGWSKSEEKGAATFRREKEAEVQVLVRAGTVTVVVSAEGL